MNQHNIQIKSKLKISNRMINKQTKNSHFNIVSEGLGEGAEYK